MASGYWQTVWDRLHALPIMFQEKHTSYGMKEITDGGDRMYFSGVRCFNVRNGAFAKTALGFVMIVLILFVSVPLWAASTSNTTASMTPKEEIAEAKRVFNEEMRKAKKVFADTIQKAKKEYRLAVKQAKEDMKSVKESSAEKAREIRQASLDTIKSARENLKLAQKSSKEEWLKAKEAAKKKYQETRSRD
jgi:biopolymer transport protein ExbB/TolQ